jgi:CHAT domain-containing protein
MIRLRMNLKNDSIIYVALVVKSTSPQPDLIIFPNGRAMEGREFSFYRNSIRFQMDNDRSYNVYWKPLEKSLASTKTLYFSADGVYNKINILTFFNPQTNLYLLEQFNIKLVSNTRELLASPKGAVSVQTASLFGYPDYTIGFVSNQQASKQPAVSHPTRAYFSRGVPELPGTKEEVDRISELLRTNKWATTLFTGTGASEAAIKAQQNTGVLHVATHGFFIPSGDDSQPVVVSQDPAQAENNPLLRSGLILSGAEKYLNDPTLLTPKTEDGVLTAYEAINLNLDRTDLVVLSACETGSGEIRNGEGVYGLQRAFLLAGANNILMSLWKVDDAATQELMVEFYNQWTKTKNKSIAFRNTQLLMKKKYDLPFYWGSFVMIGVN